MVGHYHSASVVMLSCKPDSSMPRIVHCICIMSTFTKHDDAAYILYTTETHMKQFTSRRPTPRALSMRAFRKSYIRAAGLWLFICAVVINEQLNRLQHTSICMLEYMLFLLRALHDARAQLNIAVLLSARAAIARRATQIRTHVELNAPHITYIHTLKNHIAADREIDKPPHCFTSQATNNNIFSFQHHKLLRQMIYAVRSARSDRPIATASSMAK